MNRRDFSRVMLAGAAAGMLPRRLLAHPPTLTVDGTRLNAHLAELAQFGKNPQGGVTRLAYSDADRRGRAYVIDLMRQANLSPSIDAAGNIIGRRAGRDASAKPLLLGSHVDSVPEGGNYDGPVGSLAAIEVAQTLVEHDVVTRHPLEVTIWQNEEGGLYGSRAVSGELEAYELSNVSRSGKSISDGIAFIGGSVAELSSARRAPGSIAGYLELHIEQGGTLDSAHVDIGIVEGIVGIHQWEVTVTGFANHAGTTPMDHRHDALLAGARFVDLVNRVVRAEPGRQVGTVGRIQAFPGAPNVIPGKVVLTLELRDLDAAKIDRLYRRIADGATRIAQETGTTFAYTDLHVNLPALSDPRVRALIAASARELGLSTRQLPSGAGHDAQAMARLGPMGMIFVPSVGGISHAPTEFTKPQDVTNGANVLLRTLLAMDDAMS
ncbi:MAG TPA: Zn-dependent hydrolase [Gemmatimonadaceae bacterium]